MSSARTSRTSVHEFVERDVRPVVRELEHGDIYPEALIEQMKRLGIFGLAIPEPYGEAAVSTPCYALVTEELARGWMSLAGAMGGHTVVAKLILTYGTDEQKRHYLPRMATGEIRAAMALTEPRGGSDLQAIRTVARSEEQDHPEHGYYVVDGTKTWITNARRSQLLALLCKTDPDATPSHKGISILLAEHGPGLTVSRDLPKRQIDVSTASDAVEPYSERAYICCVYDKPPLFARLDVRRVRSVNGHDLEGTIPSDVCPYTAGDDPYRGVRKRGQLQ